MVERQSKMGEKRVSRKPKSLRVFGHPPRRAKTRLRAGLYARVSTQDQQTIPMQTRALRIRHSPRLDHRPASQRNRLRRFPTGEAGATAGGRAPPRDRRGAGMAAGPLGRSVTDLLATLQELEHLGVGFVSLTEALDLTTPAGRAMAALLAVFAEFEREILRERVRAGLAHARQNGKQLGRPATAALHADKIRKLYRAGTSKSEIARRLRIGRTSVRRILAANRR